MEEVDKEISETRLSLNARARIVAESYLATVRRHFGRSSQRLMIYPVRLEFSLDEEVKFESSWCGFK